MALDATTLNDANLTEDGVRESISQITKGVFSTMVMLEVEDQYPLNEPVVSFRDTVTSMVGLAGSHCGTLAVHCPKPLALKITSNMLGMEVAEVDDDVNDALGEIANMIGGDIKHIFSPGGGDLSLSIPTVIYGSEYVLESISNIESLLIPFDCEGDRFILSFAISKL